jgi:hypothetical protein
MSLNMSLLYEESAKRTMTQAFYGLNKNLRSAEGEFFDMKNLTSDEAPVMAVRERRYIPYWSGTKPTDVITGVGASYLTEGNVCWIDGTKLRIGVGNTVDLSDLGFEESDTNRSIVKLGAYLIIVPDMIYVNTVDTEDKGVIEDSIEDTTSEYTLTVCDYEGNQVRFVGGSTPTGEEGESGASTKPKNGDMWLKTGNEPKLSRYNEETGEWYEIVSYIKITATKQSDPIIGTETVYFLFKKELAAGDCVHISGIDDAVNGKRQLAKTSEVSILLQGILNQIQVKVKASTGSPVVIKRVIPKIDYVCEAGNRLWGCRYGKDGHENFVNEIYCSARGDFFRWIQGEATNEDAPVTFSVGTDGVWTGCINYGGYPTFFKQNSIHRVSGYGASGFALQEAPCMGVQSGAERSLAVVNNILYYKADHCIMAYDGTVPVNVSDRLGRLSVYNRAVGGACGGKYYVSMWVHRPDESGKTVSKNPVLYALDTEKGLWHKEDETECESMASYGDNLYFVEVCRSANKVEHKIKAVKIPVRDEYLGLELKETEKEPAMIPWYAETGVIGLESPDSKYISRLTIRLQLDVGASVRVLVQYDSSGYWKQIAGTEADTMRTVTMPVMPARCDHMRLRLEGVGGCKVYSITKTMENGEEA